MVVGLPAPFGPSTATSRPAGMAKLMPATATKSTYRLVSWWTVMASFNGRPGSWR